jgi:uncharacterized protein (TIRG00374 family)
LLITGAPAGPLVTAALIGAGAVVVAGIVFALVFWKESLARTIGTFAGRVLSWVLSLLHRPPVTTLGEKLVEFRAQTIEEVSDRWMLLTISAVASQLAYFLVLLVSLRASGVGDDQVTISQAFAAFALVGLVTSIPVTPGGLGVAELAYVGLLTQEGGSHAEVVAGTLLFRVLTYLIQIPVGAVTYLMWRRQQTKKPAAAKIPA